MSTSLFITLRCFHQHDLVFFLVLNHVHSKRGQISSLSTSAAQAAHSGLIWRRLEMGRQERQHHLLGSPSPGSDGRLTSTQAVISLLRSCCDPHSCNVFRTICPCNIWSFSCCWSGRQSFWRQQDHGGFRNNNRLNHSKEKKTAHVWKELYSEREPLLCHKAQSVPS